MNSQEALMTHLEAIQYSQIIDKKLGAIANDYRQCSNAATMLGIPNLASEFSANCENILSLQVVISRAMSNEFRISATSGKDFVSPKMLDDFIPTLPIISSSGFSEK